LKLSSYLIATLKEAPSDAETNSHQLMVRAGMIRKIAAGVYNFLPTGLRVFRKVENIIREEMNKAGAIEVMMPFVTPADLWQKSGRWDVYGKELLRFKDRADRDFCLGPTHEEVVTDLVEREAKSYKNLPLTIYQIQPKFRDEIRPRYGVMRAREFTMKDAYSFDVNEELAEKSYLNMFNAYRNIFDRCGLTYKAVQADSGNIGGSFSHEFMVLAETGEDLVLSCDSCDFAANVETAPCNEVEPLEQSENLESLVEVETPNMTSVDEVAKFLGLKSDRIVKTLVLEADGQLIAVLIRGDHELSLTKLKKVLGVNFLELASEKVLKEANIVKGFCGPVDLNIPIYADYSIKPLKGFATGANKLNFHNINVCWESLNIQEIGSEKAMFSDLREAVDGDRCLSSDCSGILTSTRGIEVGHVFKLGTKYSESMNATFTDQDGKEKNYFMGCYGIGVGRVVAAAVEQNNDENGIRFPLALAPFQIVVISTDKKEGEALLKARELYDYLLNLGYDIAIDDRAESPGVKFKDAELIGIPFQLRIGPKSLAKGVIEFKDRLSGEVLELDQNNFEAIREKIDELL
jgi:prolyl-tRNA synthetase